MRSFCSTGIVQCAFTCADAGPGFGGGTIRTEPRRSHLEAPPTPACVALAGSKSQFPPLINGYSNETLFLSVSQGRQELITGAFAYLQQLLRPVWSIISIEYPSLVTSTVPTFKSDTSWKPLTAETERERVRGDRRSSKSSRPIPDQSRENQLKCEPSLGETKRGQTEGRTAEHSVTSRSFSDARSRSALLGIETVPLCVSLWVLVPIGAPYCPSVWWSGSFRGAVSPPGTLELIALSIIRTVHPAGFNDN